MIEVRQTVVFAKWLHGLRDMMAKARILARIGRLESGNLGDVKPVGEGISELRITYGPGYRVYFVQRGKELIILLAGGDKSSQAKDIRNAKRLAKDL
ncbi:MAG: addiction module killer protein [Acidobacteria bacterium OLB17]|nr:MAG: addiction module killer protein [Acidobacteria bacterium OLB17]MCZ2390721.1 type II toxin-antitoxin system RelE/ParE family toxin [Acidobacteriota bacterium]